MARNSLLLFLAYFRYETANVPEEELAASPPPKPQVALMVGSLCLLHAVAVIAVTGVISIVDPDMLGYWANLLGVMAAALAAVQYVPQIWTTYHLKHVGSLSIPMMCIQTPGGFLFAASLFARFGWPGWSTWGIYLLTASMQGIVLFLGIYYEVLARRNGKLPQPLGPPRAAPNDTKSTLGNGSGRRRAPVRSRSGLGDVVDDDQPAPYTAHAQEFADTPEEFERLVQREEDYVRHESEPLLRPGGIGDPHGYGGKPPPSKGPSRRYGGTDEQGSGS